MPDDQLPDRDAAKAIAANARKPWSTPRVLVSELAAGTHGNPTKGFPEVLAASGFPS
jgi:hypothetical protein